MVRRASEDDCSWPRRDGHVIHFAIDEVNVLSGAGKGVIGIKLDKDDICLGGLVCTARRAEIELETTAGTNRRFTKAELPVQGRGGKGNEIVKRGGITRVLPPAIELVDWEALDGGTTAKENKPRSPERNGKAGDLFE